MPCPKPLSELHFASTCMGSGLQAGAVVVSYLSEKQSKTKPLFPFKI